jgi:hypothetical protein
LKAADAVWGDKPGKQIVVCRHVAMTPASAHIAAAAQLDLSDMADF